MGGGSEKHIQFFWDFYPFRMWMYPCQQNFLMIACEQKAILKALVYFIGLIPGFTQNFAFYYYLSTYRNLFVWGST